MGLSKRKAGNGNEIFPGEIFLIDNRHLGAWFSLMPIGSSYWIQYDQEFGCETGLSTQALKCSENLPKCHEEAFGRSRNQDILEGEQIWLVTRYTGRGRKQSPTACSGVNSRAPSLA